MTAKNAQFKRNWAAIMKRAGDKADLVVKKVAMDIAAQLVNRSPVDTGRFRANWRVGMGAPNMATSTSTDKAGSSTVMAMTGAIDSYTTGQTIWLTNSLPYAQRLENGWSKQAPSGMVRLTILSWRRAVSNAVRNLK